MTGEPTVMQEALFIAYSIEPHPPEASRAAALSRAIRGTRFDVFDHTSERRMECDLIAWYEALLEELLPRLNVDNGKKLAEIAALPMQIRGYGPVKEAAAHTAKTKVAAQ